VLRATRVPRRPLEGSDGLGLDVEHHPVDLVQSLVIPVEIRARTSCGTRDHSADVKVLLDPVPDALWEAVPRNATFLDLPDNPLTHPTYLALVALYEAYSTHSGIKATKATKLLHLKRPYLMPIRDSVAQRAYRSTAEALAREFGQGKALYWSALWRDARRNAADMTDLATALLAGTANERLIGALSPLRSQDMLIWEHFRSPCTRSS